MGDYCYPKVSVSMIPDSILNFVEDTSALYDDVGVSMEHVYSAKIGGAFVNGSGVCIKMETIPLSRKSRSADELALAFILSDGNYAVKCLAHNETKGSFMGTSRPSHRPDESEGEWASLKEIMMLLTRSLRDGIKIVVSGYYELFNREPTFVCLDVQEFKSLNESQMEEMEFKKFIKLCNRHSVSPLSLMVSDDTLWSQLYAKDPIKLATMLFCLSPKSKQDMIHIGIVTSMGEGKDHLIEQVIEPLVPCGVASSGKLCTIPGLFGAMSGEDLNSIELGLIPKMNNERIVISEFQTWDGDVFGELMNVMANGYFTMQKGQVDTRREGKVNMMFLGNPPADWEKGNKRRKMLGAFGDYTYQILSRLTLIFTQLSLTEGEESEQLIEGKILDSMSGIFDRADVRKSLLMWRRFFKEYLRYVSGMDPDIEKHRNYLSSEYKKLKENEDFKGAFLVRSSKDFRKFQEFVNLCKGIARLHGHETITKEDIRLSSKLFRASLVTLHRDYPLEDFIAGATIGLLEIHEKLLESQEGDAYDSITDMREAVHFDNEQLDKMLHLGWIQKWDGHGHPLYSVLALKNDEMKTDLEDAGWFE